MRRTTWMVIDDEGATITVANNMNCSRYEYRRSSLEEYLADPLSHDFRRAKGGEAERILASVSCAWYLCGFDRHNRTLPMEEFTLGPDPTSLRLGIVDEAMYLAAFLNRLNVLEAQDGWHIDANLEREAGAKFETIA